jgi:hypothetical protein
MRFGADVIDTTAVDLATARAIEAAEARAWADCYAAAPPEWAKEAGISTRSVDGALVLNWVATGRRYFSRVIGLGVAAPATAEAIEDVLEGYERSGITMFLLTSQPHCQPEDYEQLLRDQGLEPFDRQERVIRDSSPLGPAPRPKQELEIEQVTRETAREWVDFLERVYRLDTGPWLETLIGRPGWHEYIGRADGEIVAARGAYHGPDGIAWLGVDTPVPGITTDDYHLDAQMCRAAVEHGLERGVRLFVSDIELASDTMETPAYENFARLGFTMPYRRSHWTVSSTEA